MKKLDPKEMAATWTVVSEQAGVASLIGTVIRIEIQQVNPMLRRAVITPVNGANDSHYSGVFTRIKPAVCMIQGDMLLCSLGIMARRDK